MTKPVEYYFSHILKDLYPMQIKPLLSLVAVLSFTALISACSPGPKSFAIRGEGDQILNRDINGKSLSVVVHIYQLKDAREFSKLTFDTLASGRSESELLGPALLDKVDVVVVPGGEYVSSEKLLDETRFVGIVAFFRNPDPYYWRQLVDAESIYKQGSMINGAHGLTFRVQDCYVVISGVKPIPLPGQPANASHECAATYAPGNRQINRPANTGVQQQPQQIKNTSTPTNSSPPR